MKVGEEQTQKERTTFRDAMDQNSQPGKAVEDEAGSSCVSVNHNIVQIEIPKINFLNGKMAI